MRKEPGPINARIAAIVHEGGTSIDRGHNRRPFDGGDQPLPRRNVVGERVARVVGGMQQQQRLALTVSVLGLDVVDTWSSGRSGYEYEHDVAAGGVVVRQTCGRSAGSPMLVAAEGSNCSGDDGLLSPSDGATLSAYPPPLTPSPLTSPVSSTDGNPNKRVILSKLRKRVIDSRNRLSLHRAWWHRCVLTASFSISNGSTHRSYRRNNKNHILRERIETSCSRRLQKINQRIRLINKKHQILRYDKIAEKYLHWEHHLREQMMIRCWGTKKNVELDRERRADMDRLDKLRRKRDGLVRMISARH